MLGRIKNLFKEWYIKLSSNRDSRSGSDIVPNRSDSAGDGAYEA
jgi:hypothetical protein